MTRTGGAFIRWPGRQRAWQPESVLSDDEISAFLADGYVAVRGAVPAPVITAAQDAIWAVLGRQGVQRDDTSTWTAPVVRIPCPEGGPFA
jgi:hypothetical protein